jgi:hypothetical protein
VRRRAARRQRGAEDRRCVRMSLQLDEHLNRRS